MDGAAAFETSTSTVRVAVGRRTFSLLLVRPVGASPDGFPVVAFGHGFLQGPQRYASTLTAVAARGYVVVAPRSERGLPPRHSRLADDLVEAIEWTRARVPSAHPTLSAVAGHSMGGGAALLAASRSREIDAVVTLAAAQTRPSAVEASRSVSAPALFVVGSVDRIVRPTTTLRMYEAVAGPASFVSITGGCHCGFNDSTTFRGLACDSGTITRSEQLALTQRVVGDWLDVTLRGRPAGRDVGWGVGRGVARPGVEVQTRGR